MVNPSTARQLLSRTPFLLKKCDKKTIDILEFKWGAEDSLFHSPKAVIKRMKLNISEDEVRKLEDNAVNIIEEEMDIVFACPNCKTDIRKCGVSKEITGFQRSEIFISASGVPTRINNPAFQPQQYSPVLHTKYKCLGCGNNIHPDSAITIFLNNRMCYETIVAYMTRFRGVSEKNLRDIRRIEPEPLYVEDDGRERDE